jgi:TRAP-type mannitol/chloroaromatic compound transport system permease small subunit
LPFVSRSREASSETDRGAPRGGAPRSWFGGVTRVLNAVGTLLILAMAIAVNSDIVGRNAFNHPLPGVLEFVGLSIVAIVFLQMANTLREDRHVSNDIIMQAVAHSSPRFAQFSFALFYAIGAALMALIVWFVWPILVNSYVGGYYQGTAGVIEIPTWPFVVAIIVGAAATSAQFLLLAWRALRRASMREPA